MRDWQGQMETNGILYGVATLVSGKERLPGQLVTPGVNAGGRCWWPESVGGP